ncbi:daptide-type RiPP biosynthesis methyltransferase [Nocardiopsis sp. FIRDI 009]|uniref:daptide-type RiPP biosynthesis methyltransferase n=1 Tax=Nocardiopsis sp. FIRDI 009 TaxID=714197 RepID=UPI000E28473C|nr:daptide-type RiPP biosynthesis methyltransferase [Nocardiopsis sp. FIRDI 009]
MTAAPTPLAPPGTAGRLVASLGERARLEDMYGPEGAHVYHDLSADDLLEVRALVRLIRGRPGPVLDLAAGSGRITLPILATGTEVTALDLSQDMLDLLAERLAKAPGRLRERCRVVRGDMGDFHLGTAFGSVVLGTTSITLLSPEGRRGLYRSVAAHLAPGGRLLVSCLDRGDGPGSPDEVVSTVTGASGAAYRLYDHWVDGADHRTVTVLPEPLPEEAVPVYTGRVGVVPSGLLRSELTDAGFRVVENHALSDPDARHRGTLLEAELAR